MPCTYPLNHYLILPYLYILMTLGCSPVSSTVGTKTIGLEVEAIGKEYNPARENIAVYQSRFSTGGSTSVRNVDKDNLKWKDQGYFQRNRDLGQVFTPEEDMVLTAVILRTGPSETAGAIRDAGCKSFYAVFRTCR
jgi:hypothetical protein